MKTLTCEELIEKLKSFPGETPVHFSYDYGDHAHIQAAPGVLELFEERIKHSDYIRGPAIEDLDDGEEASEGSFMAVVLTGRN